MGLGGRTVEGLHPALFHAGTADTTTFPRVQAYGLARVSPWTADALCMALVCSRSSHRVPGILEQET